MKKFLTTISLPVLLFVAHALPAAAQTDTTTAGKRIKVVLAGDGVQGHPQQLLFGSLLSKSADSLRIQLGAGTAPLAVPWKSVDAIYASRGVPTRKQSATGGAIGGAVAGAGIGLLMMLVTDADIGDLLTNTLLTAAGGAALGYALPQESWKRVSR